MSGLRISSEPRESADDDDDSQLQKQGAFLPSSDLPSNASQEQLLTLLVALAAGIRQENGEEPPGNMLSCVANCDVGKVNILTTAVGVGSSFTVRAVRNFSERAEERRLVFKSSMPFNYGHSERDARRKLVDVTLELRALSHPTLRNHENIVKLLGLGWDTDVFEPEQKKWPVLILDYADGGTLRDLLQRQLLLSYEEKAHLCLDVMRGLSVLHECGIIHGDLKLENILVFTRDEYINDESSRRWIAKLADFGGAITDMDQDGRGRILRTGTPPWNAPEWKSRLNDIQLTRTDVYSLGFVIWRVMASGANLFIDAHQFFPGLPLLTDRVALNNAVEVLKKDGVNFLACVRRAGRSKFSQVNFEQVDDLLGLTLQFDPGQRDLRAAIDVLKEFSSPRR